MDCDENGFDIYSEKGC